MDMGTPDQVGCSDVQGRISNSDNGESLDRLNWTPSADPRQNIDVKPISRTGATQGQVRSKRQGSCMQIEECIGRFLFTSSCMIASSYGGHHWAPDIGTPPCTLGFPLHA